MKSNLRERLFLFFCLLFFVLIVIREFKVQWIPESAKSQLVQNEINNRNESIITSLQNLKKNDQLLGFKDFSELSIEYPIFVYKDDSLIYWNSNEFKPPGNYNSYSNGIHFFDNGFSKSLILIERSENGLMYLGVNPLWKNVGIENKWLGTGSYNTYSFKWNVFMEEVCGAQIDIKQAFKLTLCFDDDSYKRGNISNSFLFILILSGLIVFGLGFFLIFNYLERLDKHLRKVFFWISTLLFTFLLFWEYARRFLIEPRSESVFFVVYPFFLAFLIASMFRTMPGRLKYPLETNKILRYTLIFLTYIFCKSYWIEIFDKEAFDLDLINFVRLEWKTLEAYIGVFGMGLFFFILISELLLVNNRPKRTISKYKFGPLLFLVGLTLLAFYMEAYMNATYFSGYLLLALVCILSELNIFKNTFQITSIGYLIVSIFVISILITETMYYGNLRKEDKLIRKYATKAFEEQTLLEKELLEKTYKDIAGDKLISIAFSNPMTSKDIINQKIKKVYLDSYFDPFEVKIDFLNLNGDNLNPQAGFRNYFFFQSNYLRKENEISPNIFVNTEEESSNDYFLQIPIRHSGKTIGRIVLEVFKDKSSPNSIFPKLLVDQRYAGITNSDFDINHLKKSELKSTGYENVIGKRYAEQLLKLENNDSFIFKVNENLFHVQNIGEELVIIRTSFSNHSNLSNFSIVFLVLSVFSLALYIIISEANYSLKSLPFRRKIQFFMNLAFLLPLVIVSLSVLNFMNAIDKENAESNYLEKVGIIAKQLEIPYLDYQNGLIPKRVFLERASKGAGIFSVDFFIYNINGELNSSSKDILWERGISNKLIDSEALNRFSDKQIDFQILESQINNFSYQTAYAKLYDLRGNNIGILGVPFYESGEELEARFIQLLSTIINVFVLTFIVFLFFSNRLTDWLMVPVLRLSDKIKITSFKNENEPLAWDIKDEIGTLVSSYNTMIDKLNESRDELAKSEKEAAWKEMAQQVAHEIKNPLTPMRLRLQQLIRQQSGNENEETIKLRQTYDSLLHQIDTLSEIASSFSEFARMPNPKNEIIDLPEVIRLSSNIYQGKKETKLDLKLPEGQIFVMADENMLSRSLGNIILNGIQSVPDSKIPHIEIRLSQKDDMALIRIKDNGDGIPEEFVERIFIPHFSTKSSGTGIGLALAKKTVESAGGKIQFKSSSTEGTEFLIELPISKEI